MRSWSAAAAIALAGSFLVMGMASQRWEVISLVLPLAVMLALQELMRGKGGPRFEARWSVGAEKVMGGDEIDITLVVKNVGTGRRIVGVEASLPDGVAVKPSQPFLADLEPGAEHAVVLKAFFPRRGRFRFGPLRLTTTSLFGMTERVSELDAQVEVRVLPKVYDIRPSTARDPRLRMTSGSTDSKVLGQGLEFFSIRPYVPSDSYRSINWKASARSEGLVVNQYMTPKSQDVTVALNAVSMSGPLLEAGVEMAAALSAHYLKQRDRVGVAIFGNWSKNIKTGYGRRQLFRIQEGLVDVQESKAGKHFKIAQIIERYHPRDSMVMLITDVQDYEVVSAVRRLTSKGRQVMVLSPFIPPRDEDISSRMRNIRREDNIFALNQLCPTLEWDATRPPAWQGPRSGSR